MYNHLHWGKEKSICQVFYAVFFSCSQLIHLRPCFVIDLFTSVWEHWCNLQYTNWSPDTIFLYFKLNIHIFQTYNLFSTSIWLFTLYIVLLNYILNISWQSVFNLKSIQFTTSIVFSNSTGNWLRQAHMYVITSKIHVYSIQIIISLDKSTITFSDWLVFMCSMRHYIVVSDWYDFVCSCVQGDVVRLFHEILLCQIDMILCVLVSRVM